MLIIRKLAELGFWTSVWYSIQLPLFVLGLVMVPVAWSCRRMQYNVVAGRRIWASAVPFWLWCNDEDGLLPEWYAYLMVNRGKRPAWIVFKWAALRNSVNNLRFVRWLSPPLDSLAIRSRKIPGGWIAWQHTRVGILCGRLYFGYNLTPADAGHPDWIPKYDWRRWGIGFRTGWLKK